MTIFRDSYETTIGSIVNSTKQISHAIDESLIRDRYDIRSLNISSHGDIKPLFITGLFDSEANITLFTHPILIKSKMNGDFLCTDLRLFVNTSQRDQSFRSGQLIPVTKNITEYNFAKSRAILNLVWVTEGPGKLKSNLSFAGFVFSTWLSETISRFYALDFKDQTIISIIASFYYQTLFLDKQEITEDLKQKLSVHTIKATRSPATFIFDIFDKIEKMDNIEDFCENVKKITENVRLKDFNLPTLLTMVRNSWYGVNAKEIISVALEHPPTFMATVYMSLVEKTYKTSNISKISDKLGKRGLSEEFVRSYTAIVKEYTKVALEELTFPDPLPLTAEV
jgi:hypothetical protein